MPILWYIGVDPFGRIFLDKKKNIFSRGLTARSHKRYGNSKLKQSLEGKQPEILTDDSI